MAGSLNTFAEALSLGMPATEAAHVAGYPRGKSEKTFAAKCSQTRGRQACQENCRRAAEARVGVWHRRDKGSDMQDLV
jgi:hypothetical protein